MNTVRINPGTRPRIEYDQGNDMIAKQIYSEKSSAAVLTFHQLARNTDLGDFPSQPKLDRSVKHTFCQLQVRYLIEFSASSSICLPISPDSESDNPPATWGLLSRSLSFNLSAELSELGERLCSLAVPNNGNPAILATARIGDGKIEQSKVKKSNSELSKACTAFLELN
jgi:hypothetical protein